jgi:hypothetical protein
LPDALPQEYVLNLSMYLLSLFSIFMTRNECLLNYLFIKALHPDLFKDMKDDTIPDYLKVIDQNKEDKPTRV